MYFANKYNVPFLAQNGGNGWSTTIAQLNNSGIIINLAALKNITFNSDKTQVTIQGGVSIGDLVAAAAAKNALVATGVCNCVGALGAILGGGIGNLMGQYGLGVDTVLNLRVVNPVGSFVNVNATSNEDLWFALRGAGPNFGIVTSATLQSHPVSESGQMDAWLGPLVFAESQLEALIGALGNLTMDPKSSYELNIGANTTDPTAPPSISVSVFYYGAPDQGKAAFAPVYAVGPAADMTAVKPYTHWNDAGNAACAKGGRKPNIAAGLGKLDPQTWRAVYGQLTNLIKEPGAENSSVTLLAYPLAKARSLANDSASYPWRQQLAYHASITPAYQNESFDSTAQEYGFRARDLWRATSGLPQNETYINNAYGDEDLSVVYGDSLQRLQQIKRKTDPLGRFNFWFGIR